jgi:cytochrome c nitrite reductase small subunit
LRWRWFVAGFVLLVIAAALAYPMVATARDDVGFCLSCHVMADAGKTHATSFHKDVATCSDCHTHSIVQKYTDGVHHLTANLAGKQPDGLRPSSRETVAAQCAECHMPTSLHARQKQAKVENCLECHSGHDPRPITIQGLDGK